ncbi:porin [Luteolibacter marinus]|uniref:porin n=1 Tax=Luteolibacter marinus TaxID=2776705 RepID=UPI001866B9D4|nr:porin [Luteolibacter marinus]
MKHFPHPVLPAGAALLLLAPLHANEALDVLEGKKDAAAVALPPAEGESEGAEKPVLITPDWAPSPPDPVWSKAVLFEDPSNPYVQQLAISGLFHWSGAWGEATPEGGRAVDLDSTRTRRARLGARMRAFNNTEIEAVAEFAGDSNFNGIERLKGTTRFLDNTWVSYGKMRPGFSIEYSTEPQDLLVPERSLLVNMVAPASTLGIMVGQDSGRWDWALGWYSSDNDSNIPGIEGDGFLLAKLGYETDEPNADGTPMRTRWHLDYIYNFDESNNPAIPRYNVAGRRSANGNQLIARNPAFRHLFSAGVEIEQGKFGFASDFILANGDTNALGLSLTPSYWALPGTLQIVGRYAYADTDDAGGLVGGMGTSSDLHFDSSPVFIGDEYHSFYLGANLHLYQDDLILMNGLEHVLLKDQAGGGFDSDAWIWHSGARLSF